jgi:predicted SprT family Zn-dependent metalloprotease
MLPAMSGAQLSFIFPERRTRNEPHRASSGPESPDARALVEETLRQRLERPVELAVTDNAKVMISARATAGGLRVRLHRMFVEATEPPVDAVARYLAGRDPRAGSELEAFIAANRHRIRRKDLRPGTMRTRGRHHDLGELFDELNSELFGGRVTARITWGRRTQPRGQRRRTIRLGAYVERERLIRIHPVLDQDWVPHFFVRYIVFHEMLHQVVPSSSTGSQRRHHGPAFQARERAFPDYERALEWERSNLTRLLRS